MKTSFWKKSVISLSILAIASSATLGFTQTAQEPMQMNEEHESRSSSSMDIDSEDMMMDDMQYYLEDYKEGYRDGFSDGFAAALEQLEDMHGDFEDDYDFDVESDDYYDDENITELEEAPSGLSPSYLPEGFMFEDAYAVDFEDGISEENASYYNEDSASFLSISRMNISEAEAVELYGEDMLEDVMTLPSVDIAGTTVYLEEESEEGEVYRSAYFSKADGLYTVDSNVSEAEMNIILSSLLQE